MSLRNFGLVTIITVFVAAVVITVITPFFLIPSRCPGLDCPTPLEIKDLVDSDDYSHFLYQQCNPATSNITRLEDKHTTEQCTTACDNNIKCLGMMFTVDHSIRCSHLLVNDNGNPVCNCHHRMSAITFFKNANATIEDNVMIGDCETHNGNTTST